MPSFITRKRILIFTPLVIVLVILVYFGLQPSISPFSGSQINLTPTPTFQVPRITPVAVDYPYTDPAKKFVISFAPASNAYTIVILSSPFDVVRTQAEQAFLTQLKFSVGQACQKHVRITTPRFANPDQAGIDYPLSFCAPSP